MTIKECIDIVDNLKPNQYSIPDKVNWLSYLDHSIINEVLLTHEGYDGRYDDFVGYSPDHLEAGLIVQSPYDRLYPAYLKMKIDEENGETARYNNSVTLFNAYLMEYKKWYNSNYMPISPSERRTLPQRKPSSMDVSEAQLEQLRKLLYAEFHDDMLKELSNDKLYAIVKSFMDTNAQMLKGKDGRDGVDGKDGADGKNGRDGSNGVGIREAEVTPEGELHVTLTSGVTMNLGIVKGEKGDKGERGMEGAKGDKGDRGAKGDKGDQGERGSQGPQGIQGERGIMGPQGIQGEKGDTGEFPLDHVQRHYSPSIVTNASGETIITTDSAEVTPVGMTLFGKSEQATYQGNQLFDVNNVVAATKSGITVEKDGDYITINGTGTESYIIFGDWACDIPSGTTVWFYVVEGDASDLGFYLRDENKGLVHDFTYVKSVTIDKDAKYFRITCKEKTYNTKLKIMLTAKENAEWEPYVGGEASPSLSYKQDVVGVGQRLATGKQLLDYENSFEALNGFEVTKMPDGGLHIVGTNENSNVAHVVSLFPPKDATYLEKGKTYTYTCRGSKGNVISLISSATNVNSGVQHATFVWQQSGQFEIKIAISANSSIDTIIYPMLVEGTYTPLWEPYGAKEGSAVDVNVKQTIYNGNICPETFGSITSNGITFDFKGDHVVVKGTKPADVSEANSANLNIMLPIIKGTYYLPTGYTSGASMAVVKADGTRTYPSKQWTFDGTELFARFYISVSKANTSVTVDEVIPLRVSLGSGEVLPDSTIEPQNLYYETPNGLGGIPLGQTIPSEIANSPIHMSGVYHDGKQYWIGNTKNENGKDVQRVKRIIPNKPLVFGSRTDYGRVSVFIPTYFENTYFLEGDIFAYSNIAQFSSWSLGANGTFCINGNNIYYKDATKTLEEVNAKFAELGTDVEFVGVLREPIVTDLTEEELAQYNAIHMNYPNTTIVNSDSAYTEVEYVADTKCYIDKKFKELEANVTSAIAQLL